MSYKFAYAGDIALQSEYNTTLFVNVLLSCLIIFQFTCDGNSTKCPGEDACYTLCNGIVECSNAFDEWHCESKV